MPFLTGSLLQRVKRGIPGYVNPVSMPFLTGSLLQQTNGKSKDCNGQVSMPFLTGSLLQPIHLQREGSILSRFYALFNGQSVATDPFFVPYFIRVFTPIFTVDFNWFT